MLGPHFVAALGWSAIESVLALIQIALPYILPFYVLLYILEDWGYIARISFLMDNLMHKMGIHGKGCISFIIGFGCNVPGCLSCRIMESKRERFITALLVTLIPCSAVSVIVFGLVGKYVGILWAFGLYLFAVALVFLVGKISSKFLLGEPVELIMPMPDYKTPHLKTIAVQTWEALKEFIFIAAPLVIISGIVIQAINLAGWMPAISSFLSPVTVTWLGLPAITGISADFRDTAERADPCNAGGIFRDSQLCRCTDFATDDHSCYCKHVLCSVCCNHICPLERIRVEKGNYNMCS